MALVAVDSVLGPGYGALFERAMTVLSADRRVRAVWLGGSLARGDADQASDLDLLVAVADDGLDAFAAEWRTWLAQITPTVIAEPLTFLPGSFYSTTPAVERLDVIVEPASRIPTSPFRTRVAVYDPDGLDARLPAPDPEPGPSDAKLAELVEWFAGILAAATIVGDDELIGYEIVHSLRWVMYLLCTELNRPWPTTGLKQWSNKLTDGQRQALTALPTAWSPDAPFLVCDALAACVGREVEPAAVALDLPKVLAPPAMVFDLGLAGIIREWFRIQSLLPVILHRHDWLLGVEGTHTLRRLLYMLFVYENGAELPATLSEWTSPLSEEQRSLLRSLPTGSPTREGAVEGHAAIAAVFEPRARDLAMKQEVTWPSELATAVTAYLSRSV